MGAASGHLPTITAEGDSSSAGGEPHELRHESGLHSIAFSPDGKHLAIGAEDNTAWV